MPRGWLYSKAWTSGSLKRYGQLGYLGINLPATHGGHGMGHLDAVIAMEEFAKV